MMMAILLLVMAVTPPDWLNQAGNDQVVHQVLQALAVMYVEMDL